MSPACFCAPALVLQTRHHVPAVTALAPRMCAASPPPGVKLELDALFSSVTPPACSAGNGVVGEDVGTVRQTSETPATKLELDAVFASINPVQTAPAVEEQYRKAKEAYKAAKTAVKAFRKTEDDADKMARKAAKKERKAKERAIKLKEKQQPVVNDTVAPVETGVATVCGGKTCSKLGAQLVADVLGRAGLAVKGQVPNAPCMKMCGGGGPTVRVGGKCVKVDLKSTVLKAVEGQQT